MWNWILTKLGIRKNKVVVEPLPKINEPTPVDPVVVPPADDVLAIRKRFVALFSEDIGQRETNGKNRSPLIDMINKMVKGAYIGAPYCMSAIVARAIMRLCKELGWEMPDWMNTASTQSFYNNCPQKYRIPKGSLPKMGDIGIMQSYSNAGSGHAYMLEEDEKGSSQKTIEANTDGSGGRDGDGWYQRKRTQNGDLTKKYRGSVDVIQALIDHNKKLGRI